MKILFTRFPLESALGGAEIQTLSLMEGLQKDGHSVAFVGSCPVLLEHTAKQNILQIQLDIGAPPVTKWGAISFFWRKQFMTQKILGILNNIEGIDAIFMLSLSEKLLATEWAAKKGIRVFWVEHDRIGPWLTKNPWLTLLKKQSEHATTICVSELSRKLYVDLGWSAQKTIAIPNGIDPHRFSQSPAPSTRPKEIHIGCIARLSKEKGIDILLNAVKNIPHVTLTILGKGPEENALKRMTAKNTSIISSVPDVGAFYQSLDMLVLPSRDHDPFGLVAAEAMMLGIPVIVTDACGIAGYLENDKDAIIVKANNSAALQKGIQKLLNQTFRNRIARAGQNTARKRYTVTKMVSEYEELLRS